MDEPLYFNEDYGRVTNWYSTHKNKRNTTIQRMQLRKEHAAPAYHEYILVHTRNGYLYRVDRSRNGPIFETIKEQGVPPQDTIAPLQFSSLQELHQKSFCVIDLQWGGIKTIDLKLILDICYQVHNESGRRYKLLTHNCYFLAQTIIMIAVRKTATIKVELDKALIRAMSDITGELCQELYRKEVGVVDRLWQLSRKLGWELGRKLGGQLGVELGGGLDSMLGGKLGGMLGSKLGEMGGELERELLRDIQQDPERVRRWERWTELERQEERSEQKQNWRWGERPVWNDELKKEKERRWKHLKEWDREQLWVRLRKREMDWKLELDRELKLALQLAQEALAKVLQLAFSGELVPDWDKSDTLVKAVPNKFASIWYVYQ